MFKEPLAKILFICHSRENGNPEVIVFKEDWIPDKNLGNDKLRLLQEPPRGWAGNGKKKNEINFMLQARF